MLFTDQVLITIMIADTTFNNMAESSSFKSKAYVENNTKIKYGQNGQPIDADFLVFLPHNIQVTLQDTLTILKLHGTSPVGDEIGTKQIKEIKRVGGIRISHLEVFV